MLARIGLGELLWSLLVLYLIVQYLIVFVTVVFDLVRSDDLSGAKKALWAAALFFFPLVSVITYLVLRGSGIGPRNAQRARQAQEEIDSYIRSTAGASVGIASELATAAALRDAGNITDDEYAALKAKLLA